MHGEELGVLGLWGFLRCVLLISTRQPAICNMWVSDWIISFYFHDLLTLLTFTRIGLLKWLGTDVAERSLAAMTGWQECSPLWRVKRAKRETNLNRWCMEVVWYFGQKGGSWTADTGSRCSLREIQLQMRVGLVRTGNSDSILRWIKTTIESQDFHIWGNTGAPHYWNSLTLMIGEWPTLLCSLWAYLLF